VRSTTVTRAAGKEPDAAEVKIVEHWGIFDNIGMLQQLGVLAELG
jgi:hypothetical protein